MREHPLAAQLQKLQESSKHAVADGRTYSLDSFKEYLHIEREVETLLKKIIKDKSNSTAALIMVCGNVGDGKSHLLSKLNHELSEQITSYKIHNDATESHNPNESSNDTLNRVLDEFSDEKLDKSRTKLILAINLGTLSKFLEEHGEEYTKLRAYVKMNKILDSDAVDDSQSQESDWFYHVNFTDYHMYSLTADGPKSLIISALLKRLISKTSENIIYEAYEKTKELAFSNDCPIRRNYEFLFNEDNREAISNLIIQSIVKYKEIISVRSLLNFFFDLIVPVGLSWENLDLYKSQVEECKETEYLSYLIPNYVFEHPELSGLFDKFSRLDPCAYRDSRLDYNLIELVNAEEPSSFYSLSHGENVSSGIAEKLDSGALKSPDLTKFYIRSKFFENRKEVAHHIDPYFKKYMSTLYHFNNHQRSAKKEVYKLVQEAARKWYGDPKRSKKVVVKIGRNQSKYRVFKNFKAEPALKNEDEKTDETLTKFVQEFTLYFNLDNSSEHVRIHIDFGLYEILNRILKGYLPNKKDNNNYISFVSLINQLINQDSGNATLEIDEINIGKSADYELTKDSFGEYKFQSL